MKLPKSTKPVVWAVILTALVMPFVLTYGFGFSMASTTEAIAAARAEQMAVPLAARLCAIEFNSQPDARVLKVKLENAPSYSRNELFEEAWVTLPGQRYKSSEVVTACSDIILKKPAKAAAAK